VLAVGAVVRADCEPPVCGTVERVDRARRVAWVQVENDVVPFGWDECRLLAASGVVP